MTDTNAANSEPSKPLGLALTDQLGPSVPNEVMTYVHAYGDSRADEDGRSALRIGETVLALRRWAAQLQADERERCAKLCEELETSVWRTYKNGGAANQHTEGRSDGAGECAALIRGS